MKRFFVLAGLLILAVSRGMTQPAPPAFDFSGIDRFWTIVSVLERDREPAEEQWTALFQTPGYRELMRHEPFFSRAFFKERFRLVFMPSRAAELKEALAKKKSGNLEHFAEIKTRRKELDRLRARIERGSLMDEALGKTREFLPPEAMCREAHPPVSFIFFDADARGYSPIIVDLSYVLDTESGFVDLLAHEAHHYYRDRNRAYDEGDVQARHVELINSLEQLQKEGIADQIDKHGPFFSGPALDHSAYAERYRKNVAEAPRLLASYNERLGQMADQPDLAGALPLVTAGHPTGYYMTRRIIDNGDRAALVATVGNPFAFFYLYNKAALKNNPATAFGAKAIGFLRRIERLYCPHPEEALAVGATPAGLDLSAFDQFWKIADILGRGEEPPPEEWDRLFGHAAYTELMRSEGWQTRDAFRDKISLVFKPSRASELQARLAEKNGTLLHLSEVKARRAEIEAYAAELKSSGWADGIMKDLAPFLPERVLKTTPPPIQVPAVFSPDLRFGYSVFIFDPLYGTTHRPAAAYYARRHAWQYFYYAAWPGDPQDVKQRHSGVIDTLDGLALGGFQEIAAPRWRLNKDCEEGPAAEQAEAERAFEGTFPASIQALKDLDERLGAIDRNPAAEDSWSSISLGDFPLQGRAAGFLMARAIVENLGRERLAAVFGDPFAFFEAFREAALKQPDRYPVSSEGAVRVMESLRKEYVRRKVWDGKTRP
jgi:hypothetical protein